MNRKPSREFARSFSKILAVTTTIILATPAAAEPAGDPARINLLRLDRLLVQITEQDGTETASDHYWRPVAYVSGQDRGYRDVSRSNLLNSPAARYFARKVIGSGRN